ncbi:MAG: hypothetical protein GKR89_22180 [Candidatus Latescibacteria bacterium]|nr:hypothetical protein [Candidatus Latescibacterota bacterium]
MRYFSVEVEEIPLPQAATPRMRRMQVCWRERPVLDLTQGDFRAYIYPLYSPAGVPLTAESPVDHPHHNSVVCSADVVVAKLPPLTPDTSSLEEEATYNLYVNQVFQGRAPGRIWSVGVESREVGPAHLQLVQTLYWQGPEEWGAAAGRRTLAIETRTIDVYPGATANAIDIRSQLRPTEWDLRFGPTRHAYFTVRVAHGLRPVDGGCLLDSEGRVGDAAIRAQTADWVDMSGPASHGQQAGLTVVPHASLAGLPWIVVDWGTITVNPFQHRARLIPVGETLDLGLRLLAHDGDAQEADVAGIYEVFTREGL